MGVRVSRVLAYKRDLNSRRTTIISKPPKSGKSRFVTFDDATMRVLVAYRNVRNAVLAERGVRPRTTIPLFCHSDGSFFTPREITELFGALVKELGLDPKTHLHTLRHTHASYLIANGADLRAVQEPVRSREARDDRRAVRPHGAGARRRGRAHLRAGRLRAFAGR